MRKALFPFRLLYFFYRKVLKVFCRDRKEYLRILVNTSLRVEHSNLFRRYASLPLLCKLKKKELNLERKAEVNYRHC